MTEKDQRYFHNGQARHYMKHKVYCNACSHYEIEISHWDGTSFSVELICAHCNNTTLYRYSNPYDNCGAEKKK